MMLLTIASLTVGLSSAMAAALELAATPTSQHRFEAIFPRETGLAGLLGSSECSSVITKLLDIPFLGGGGGGGGDLSGIIQQIAGAVKDPCASKYKAQVTAWLGSNKDALAKCPELAGFQSRYSEVCKISATKSTSSSSSDAKTSDASSATTSGAGGSSSTTNDPNSTASSSSKDASSSSISSGDNGAADTAGGSKTESGSASDKASNGISFSYATIIGMSVGGVVVLGIIGALIGCLVRKSRTKPAGVPTPMDQAEPRLDRGMVQQPGQPYDKSAYPYPPQGDFVYEMPGAGGHSPSELMGSTPVSPMEFGLAEPAYEMSARHQEVARRMVS